MLKGTLYVTDHRARLRMRHGSLLVDQGRSSQRIPIESIEGVVLTGRAEMTNDSIGELVSRGVRIAALSRTGRLRFVISGAGSGNVHLRMAQHQAAVDPLSTAAFARSIVAGKLQNYRRCIGRWIWNADGNAKTTMRQQMVGIEDRIRDLAGVVNGDKIRGIEGDGTRRYFQCLGLHLDTSDELMRFTHRNRRPPRDPVNALLGFTYGLLLAELVGALDGVGLDPQIGFLHRPRSGRPALALDLLEELRPSVADKLAVSCLARRQIRLEHFQFVGDGCYLNDRGRACFLELYESFREEEVHHPVLARRVGRWMLPSVQATLMARALRGDLPGYPPFIADA